MWSCTICLKHCNAHAQSVGGDMTPIGNYILAHHKAGKKSNDWKNNI